MRYNVTFHIPTVDQNQLKQVMTLAIDILDEIDHIERELSKNDDELKFQLDKIGMSAVDRFYDSYSPRFYRRLGDLYNAYKVNIDYSEHERYVEMGSEFMEYAHHQENDLIYWIAFVNGVHGGFPSQDFQGRVPVGIFSEFSSHSQPSSVAPQTIINREAQAIIETYNNVETKLLYVLKQKLGKLKDQVSALQGGD